MQGDLRWFLGHEGLSWRRKEQDELRHESREDEKEQKGLMYGRQKEGEKRQEREDPEGFSSF